MTEVISQNAEGNASAKRDFRKSTFIADTCCVCEKSCYPVEKVVADNKIMHKSCLRCAHCNKTVSLGNYASLNGSFYCKPHFKQLFALKGNYSDGFAATQQSNKRESTFLSVNKRDSSAVFSESPTKREISFVAEGPSSLSFGQATSPSEPSPKRENKSFADRLLAYQSEVARSMSESSNMGTSSNAKSSFVRDYETNATQTSPTSVSPTAAAAGPHSRRMSSHSQHRRTSNGSVGSHATGLNSPSLPAASSAVNDELEDLRRELEKEIAQRKTLESDVNALNRKVAEQDERIAELEEENEKLKTQAENLETSETSETSY